MFHDGKKVNHWILYFFYFGLCLSLSTRLNIFFQRVYTCQPSFFFILCSIKIKFSFLKQWWMVDFVDLWWNICTKDGDLCLLFYHWILDWYRKNDDLNWLTSSSMYLKWKEWWYNIAWLCLNWLLILHQLYLLPEMEVFFKLFS